MYCKNCGPKIDEISLFCSKCGKPVQEREEVVVKKCGKGSSIASMVLGIISVFFAISIFLSSGVMNSLLNITNDFYLEVNGNDITDYYDEEQATEIFDITLKSSVFFSGLCFILPCSITGLCLGVSGRRKAKNGFNKSGIILSAVAIGIFIFNFIFVMI